MKLSTPIYGLRRKAKLLSRQTGMALHEALDRVAAGEGCRSWSLLVAQLSPSMTAARLLRHLDPGDLVLLGARPGHGKTLLGLQLAVEATNLDRQAAFFSLEHTASDVLSRLSEIGAAGEEFPAGFEFHGTHAVNSCCIIDAMAAARAGTLVIVDYLQVLDQKRTSPELAVQVRLLQSMARERGLIIVFISQIDRTYDASSRPFPDLRDVRLPNPLDLGLFDKSCFLNNGEARFRVAA